MKDLVYLVPLFPLIGFLINGLFWKSMPKKVSGTLASVAILASFAVSLGIFFQINGHPDQAGVVHLFDFIKSGSLNIPFAFQVDALSSLFLLIITGVGFLIHVYSTSYMHEEPTEHYGRYFA